MATPEQVRELLDSGHSYETAARELGIPTGQAFMIATGLPVDASGVPEPAEARSGPELPGSSQDLVNPPAFNPTRSRQVMEWVRERAARELEQGA